jgi:hypothetical protein
MAPLKQWNGTTWLDVANEVVVDPAEPTDPAVELWLDSDEPATGGADLWVNTTGDTMTGQLGLITPTLITNAARWADGIPRFATLAERDNAYAAIGGAQSGMQCHVDVPAPGSTYIFSNGQWKAGGAKTGWAEVKLPAVVLPAAVSPFVATPSWQYVSGCITAGGGGSIVSTTSGFLLFSVVLKVTLNPAGNVEMIPGFGPYAGATYWGGGGTAVATAQTTTSVHATGVIPVSANVEYYPWFQIPSGSVWTDCLTSAYFLGAD